MGRRCRRRLFATPVIVLFVLSIFISAGCSKRITRLEYEIPDNSVAKHDYSSGVDHEEWRDDNPKIEIHKLTGGLISGPCGLFWAVREYVVELAPERSEYTLGDIRLFEVVGDDHRHQLELKRGHLLVNADEQGGTLTLELVSRDGSFHVDTTFQVTNDPLAGSYYKRYYQYRD